MSEQTPKAPKAPKTIKATAIKIDVDDDSDAILRFLDSEYQTIAEMTLCGSALDMAIDRLNAIRGGWVQHHCSYMVH